MRLAQTFLPMNLQIVPGLYYSAQQQEQNGTETITETRPDQTRPSQVTHQPFFVIRIGFIDLLNVLQHLNGKMRDFLCVSIYPPLQLLLILLPTSSTYYLSLQSACV